MEKTRSKFVDRIEEFLRFATPLGAIVAFLIGIYHYRDSKHEEFKRIFWEHRHMIYQELTDITGAIANTPDSIGHDTLSRKFWIIFWGKSILFEDREVYESMRDFSISLDRASVPDSLPTLQRKALHVANACRESLRNTWEPVPLHDGIRDAEK